MTSKHFNNSRKIITMYITHKCLQICERMKNIIYNMQIRHDLLKTVAIKMDQISEVKMD